MKISLELNITVKDNSLDNMEYTQSKAQNIIDTIYGTLEDIDIYNEFNIDSIKLNSIDSE